MSFLYVFYISVLSLYVYVLIWLYYNLSDNMGKILLTRSIDDVFISSMQVVYIFGGIVIGFSFPFRKVFNGLNKNWSIISCFPTVKTSIFVAILSFAFQNCEDNLNALTHIVLYEAAMQGMVLVSFFCLIFSKKKRWKAVMAIASAIMITAAQTIFVIWLGYFLFLPVGCHVTTLLDVPKIYFSGICALALGALLKAKLNSKWIIFMLHIVSLFFITLYVHTGLVYFGGLLSRFRHIFGLDIPEKKLPCFVVETLNRNVTAHEVQQLNATDQCEWCWDELMFTLGMIFYAAFLSLFSSNIGIVRIRTNLKVRKEVLMAFVIHCVANSLWISWFVVITIRENTTRLQALFICPAVLIALYLLEIAVMEIVMKINNFKVDSRLIAKQRENGKAINEANACCWPIVDGGKSDDCMKHDGALNKNINSISIDIDHKPKIKENVKKTQSKKPKQCPVKDIKVMILASSVNILKDKIMKRLL